MRREQLFLTDMLEAAESIRRFLQGVDRAGFIDDELRQSAVLQKLTLIGEAAARLPEEFRERHPEVKWRSAIGLRNVAVHEYFSINWETIWYTATEDVPMLREQTAHILAAEFSEQADTDERD